MSKLKKIIVIFLFYPIVLIAGTDSGERKILNIGCHRVNGNCYVTISGSPVGPSECNSNSVRWNSDSDTNGKIALTHLTTAFIAGKNISFQISDICYEFQNNYPTFDWWYVR